MRRRIRRSGLRAASALWLWLGLAAGAAGEPPPPCPAYATPAVRAGKVPASVPEMSGLAASRRHPGVYWTHNDSGNPFELFAMRADGAVVAHMPLRGGENVDCEDVAVGPCRGDRTRSCIYLADVGDNLERRREASIYEIPEPGRLVPQTLVARRLRFRYPDRPHNVETLLADPRDGTLYLVTKEIDSLGSVYRLQGLAPGATGQAVRVRSLLAPAGFGGLTTAGDVHPSGTRVLLRTYSQVWEYRAPASASIADVLGARLVAVPGATQPQAEAIAYTSAGDGYLLGTEKAGSPLYRVDCAR